MTDVPSVKAHADPQPASLALPASPPPPDDGSPLPVDGAVDDESSTIKCICGFSDDDGHTVFCETCDTWQHVVCYYEVPPLDTDVHECADCLPRSVDAKSAAEKQRLRRESHGIDDRKGKPKTTVRNPKKRAKDPSGAVQSNGWPMNNDLHYNPDRKSGSPRDQPPPNKRPKTTHRASVSVSLGTQAPALTPASRKRGGSVMINGHSPVKSPTNPDAVIEDYSSEFMNLYRQAEPPTAAFNSYTHLDVPNDIASWLIDPEALAEATGGKKPQDLFSRIESTIQELEQSTAPEIVKQTEIDTGITAHGLNPQWHFVVVETPVAEGGYIGELKGLIGRKADYFSDPSNRWDLLQHPEPFVFFPPYLPIYIDTRREGSILRYARRSCIPNMSMKILIESSNEYHFCFLAKRQIDPGEELTVGWDIVSDVQRQLAKVVTNGGKEFRRIQPWVSCVLANFGGCACDTSTGHECLLERARRSTAADLAAPKTKGRKSKKSQISPLSTGRATNSRAGSEALNRDAADDDQLDARSTSGSHKSSSRDITPATHFSVDGDLKMSDREKRKLQQQERLFEQLEFDEQHKGKKGKRSSAGSALNTPGLPSARRLGNSEPSPSARHREHSHGVARKTSGSSTKTIGRVAPKPKPVYKEASTQTDDNADVPPQNCIKLRDMKPPMSFKRKLLQQAQEDKIQRERIRSTSIKRESKSPALRAVSSSKPSPLPPSPPLDEPSTMDVTTGPDADVPHKELTPAKELTPTPTVDVEMEDAEEAADPKSSEPKDEELPDAPEPETSSGTSHPPIQPPAPPWPASTPIEPSPVEPPPAEPAPAEPALTEPTPTQSVPVEAPSTEPAPTEPSPTVKQDPSPNPTALKIEMPARPEPSNAAADSAVTPATGTAPAVLADSTIAQSPNTVTPASPFSPAVHNAVKATPARKKLSLSDYTNRRAKLAQTQSSTFNAATSNAQSQATSSPTLSTASLPNGSPPKAVSPILSTVKEESKTLETGTAMATISSTSTST